MNSAIPVLFSEKVVAINNISGSPSAKKPGYLVKELIHRKYPVTIVTPKPVTIADICNVHDKTFVHDVMTFKTENGFGNKSHEVAYSLPYTSGAMFSAACLATPKMPACAPVSGFHHAGYNNAEGFCTFNGLAIAAYKFLQMKKKVAIIDCDYHFGDGTEEILEKKNMKDVYHVSFGKDFYKPEQSQSYLRLFDQIRINFQVKRPDVVLYQAGADTHIDDPLGGILTTEQMYLRDYKMFSICHELGIPIAWNLAGGYQVDDSGSFMKVIELHLNTFKAAAAVYKVGQGGIFFRKAVGVK